MPQINWEALEGGRLDVLCAQAADTSRSQAAKWIESGLCVVNGAVQTKTSFKVPQGAKLEITVPHSHCAPNARPPHKTPPVVPAAPP